MAVLQGLPSFDEDAILCSQTSAYHHSSGRGQTQSTRTGNYEDRNAIAKGHIDV